MDAELMNHFTTLLHRTYCNGKHSIGRLRDTLLSREWGDNLREQRSWTEGIVRAHERMELINAAMQRLHQGRFGQCVDCGAELPQFRLRAQPWLERCARCCQIFPKDLTSQ